MYVKFKTANSTSILDMSKVYININNHSKLLTLHEYGISEYYWIPEIQDLEKWEKALLNYDRGVIYDIDIDSYKHT